MRDGAAEELDGEWGVKGYVKKVGGEQEDYVSRVCIRNLSD